MNTPNCVNVLVTGVAGFLGEHVFWRLVNSGKAWVSGADNLERLAGHEPPLPGVGDPIDVTDFSRLVSTVAKLDITHIVHLAALGRNLTCQDHAFKAWQVNVTGTANVLEVARRLRVRRVVVCSSNIVLSDQPTVYKQTKKTCEDLVQLYTSLGVSCMGLRPSNIYGAGQSKSEYQLCAFAGLDKSYAEHRHFKISGDGSQSRDWVHAEDVARAFEMALFSDVKGVTLDVCTGNLTSMNAIAQMLGADVEYTPARPGDAKELISDPLPAKTLLGFEAQIALQDRIRDAFPSVPQ